MPGQVFEYEVVRLIVNAECERLKRFPLPGRRLSVAAYALPAPLPSEQMRELARSLTQTLRGYDVVSVADQQTVLLFHPETDPRNATKVAVRIRDRLVERLADFGQNGNYVKIAIVSFSGTPPVERAPEELLPLVLSAVAAVRPGMVEIIGQAPGSLTRLA